MFGKKEAEANAEKNIDANLANRQARDKAKAFAQPQTCPANHCQHVGRSGRPHHQQNKRQKAEKASDIRNQTLTKKMNIVDLVAKVVVEGKNSLVVLPNAKLTFGQPFSIRKAFRPAHQFSPETGSPMLRRHGKIIYAAPMPVITDHDRRDDNIIFLSHPKGPVPVGHLPQKRPSADRSTGV